MTDHRDHLRALHAAYVEATGVPVTLSPERLKTLREFDRRGLTAADVAAVLGKLKALVARGIQGYTDASLDWRNAMANVDTFEERALKIRQEKARKSAVKPARPAAVTVQLGAGESVTRLAVPAEAPAEVPRVGATLTDAVLAQIAQDRAKGDA